MLGKKPEQNQELIDLELDIFMFTKGKWRLYGYTRRMFCYLRAHMELCESGDYKKFYDECLYYLILHARTKSSWTEEHPKNQKGWVELLADLENEHSDENSRIFTEEEVKEYLEHRKKRWADGFYPNIEDI